MLRALLYGAAGAALAYFWDSENGRRRRATARDRTSALLRQRIQRTGRYGRFLAGRIYGAGQELIHRPAEQARSYDDATLAQKVETELFRDPRVPKGKINVNAEHGCIVLRGEVERPEQIKEIETIVRRVAGVADVENRLRLPATPAPAT
jgi:osmotically-inducible protein OsmY